MMTVWPAPQPLTTARVVCYMNHLQMESVWVSSHSSLTKKLTNYIQSYISLFRFIDTLPSIYYDKYLTMISPAFHELCGRFAGWEFYMQYIRTRSLQIVQMDNWQWVTKRSYNGTKNSSLLNTERWSQSSNSALMVIHWHIIGALVIVPVWGFNYHIYM